MKLNLKQVLALAELPKHTFDARRRRDLHGFLHDSPSTDAAIAEYANSRSRWGIEHALALRCVDWMVEHCGITVETADNIVANNIGELFEAVAEGHIDPDDDFDNRGRPQRFLFGRMSAVIGRAHIAGNLDQIMGRVLRLSSEYNDRPQDTLAGLVLVDATVIYRQLKASMTKSGDG